MFSLSGLVCGLGPRSFKSALCAPVYEYAYVIVSLYAATGATMGDGVRSRTVAALLGIPLHLAGDRVPHRDIAIDASR